jgi:tetratricopeptide (TPR) repeat protein
MGQPLLHAKQHDHAAAWISRAIQQNPTADYLAALATALQHQGKLAEALKALDQAIKLKADDAGCGRLAAGFAPNSSLPVRPCVAFSTRSSLIHITAMSRSV